MCLISCFHPSDYAYNNGRWYPDNGRWYPVVNVVMERGAALPATSEKALHQIGTLIGQYTGSNNGLRVKQV